LLIFLNIFQIPLIDWPKFEKLSRKIREKLIAHPKVTE